MSEPFRNNDHSIQARIEQIEEEIHVLEHRIRLARTGLEPHEEAIAPIRSNILDAMTWLLVIGGLVLGGVLADRIVAVRTVEVYHPCGIW